VLRIIFGQKRDKVRRLEINANEELHDFCSSPSIIRMIRSKRRVR
jgi:hypothetical protein